ncbi:hypothetical protein AVEN_231692-1 [Araneus ventricosus]|uniref:Uncharacterized protein n=1 Tax=Araneus ventricosus TaxID=182803 RepID=A0A4Y2RA67_ARAVE|nr:hypothetical protein AVEN_50265-1 [Araneus ventricosus]GBN71796.1 hypothetical protein AVEN_231692-1 [Araneus ventricosus]
MRMVITDDGVRFLSPDVFYKEIGLYLGIEKEVDDGVVNYAGLGKNGRTDGRNWPQHVVIPQGNHERDDGVRCPGCEGAQDHHACHDGHFLLGSRRRTATGWLGRLRKK